MGLRVDFERHLDAGFVGCLACSFCSYFVFVFRFVMLVTLACAYDQYKTQVQNFSVVGGLLMMQSES